MSLVDLLVFNIEVRILSSSIQSERIDFTSDSDKYAVAFNSLNQYLVSAVSFNEIDIFEIKSAVLCACCASATFAPILVPHLNNCFDITFSFFVKHKYLYKLIILTAKAKLLSSIIFSIV